jgi:hypothetical protein
VISRILAERCSVRFVKPAPMKFLFLNFSLLHLFPDIFLMWLKRQAIKMVSEERHQFPEDEFTAKIVFKEVFE